jgi:hypothetical protein
MSACITNIRLLLILFILPAFLSAQEKNDSSKTNGEQSPEKVKKQRSDTIQLFEKEPMYVNVLKITYDSIIYTEPGETELRRLGKDHVNKIVYNWGRVEILNEKPPKYPERYNWRKVEILENKNKTKGLYMVEKIEAKAEGSSRGYDTPKSLEMRAKVILRKKAANINAKYVLITSKTVTIAFGELPSATIKGIAYTDEKPEDREE